MRFIIPHEISTTLNKLVEHFPREFTVFGKTEVNGEDVRLVDIRVPDQTSTMSNTEVTADELEKFMIELIDAGENPAAWNMWIHSHNTMGAFWSNTDTNQMQSFNSGGPQYFFHIVISTKGMLGAVSIYKPFNCTINDVKIDIEDPGANNPAVAELKNQMFELHLKLQELLSQEPSRLEPLKKLIEEKNKFYTPTNTTPYGQYQIPGYDDPPTEQEEWDEDRTYGSKLSPKKLAKFRRKAAGHPETCCCHACIQLYNWQLANGPLPPEFD